MQSFQDSAAFPVFPVFPVTSSTFYPNMIPQFPLQPNKEVSVEKTFKIDEEDAKPKLTETRKVI